MRGFQGIKIRVVLAVLTGLSPGLSSANHNDGVTLEHECYQTPHDPWNVPPYPSCFPQPHAMSLEKFFRQGYYCVTHIPAWDEVGEDWVWQIVAYGTIGPITLVDPSCTTHCIGRALCTITTEKTTFPPTLSSSQIAEGQTVGQAPTSVEGAPLNCQSDSQTAVGCPVNVSTGAMWDSVTDFVVKGRTPATSLALKRTYASQAASPKGDFGANWRHNWETEIFVSAGGDAKNPDITWVDESGGAWKFTRQVTANGLTTGFTAPPGLFASLSEGVREYVLTKKDGTRLTFSRDPAAAPIGKLLRLSEPHGEAVSLSYGPSQKLARVEAPFAGALRFDRDTSGRVVSVTREKTGLVDHYSYDSSGKMVSWHDDFGRSLSYFYHTPAAGPLVAGMLASIEDQQGMVVTFHYDEQGRAQSQVEAGGATRLFSYSSDSAVRETRVTEIDGSTTLYSFDSKFRLVRTVLPDGSVRSQSWNEANRISSLTDELGRTTVFAYDTLGNRISVKRPGDTDPTTMEFDPKFSKPLRLTPPVGSEWVWAVDPDKGDILSVRRSDETGAITLPFTVDPFGNRLGTGAGNAFYTNIRDENGLLTGLPDAYNPETREYDGLGRWVARLWSSGARESVAYDPLDRIIHRVSRSGIVSDLNYDPRGRVTRVVKKLAEGSSGESRETKFTWDARNRLESVQDAVGAITRYAYEFGDGRVLDKPSSITDPKGQVTRFEYDNRQRLVQKIDARGGITRFAYSPSGEILSVTDPNDQTTRFTYDLNSRPTRMERPSVILDASGAPAAATELTQYTYDALDRIIRLESGIVGRPSTSTVEYTYDLLGRIVRRLISSQKSPDAAPVIDDDSSFNYERRLDTNIITRADNPVERLVFDSASLPPFSLLESHARPMDPSNPLSLLKTDFKIARDGTGGVSAIDLPFGRVSETLRDPLGRITATRGFWRGDEVAFTLSHDAWGRRSSVAASNGLRGEFGFDLMDRLTNLSWAGLGKSIRESLSYDLNGNPSTLDREIGGQRLFYDEDDQLVRLSFPKSHGQRSAPPDRVIAYDANGNRVRDSFRGESTYLNGFLLEDSLYRYYPTPDGSGAVGFIESKSGDRGLAWKFTYRADGKLLTVERGRSRGGEDKSARKKRSPTATFTPELEVRYYYDAMDRRVAKAVFKVEHSECEKPPRGKKGGDDEEFSNHHHPLQFAQRFAYAGLSDRVLLGSSGNGKVTVYVDGDGIDEHLGQIDARGPQAYVTDHLGSVLNTPVTGGTPGFEAWGQALTPREIPLTPSTPPVMYGYAGRSFDPESGTYYYRARQYLPGVGRFMSKDPIGFKGGDTNLYRYVRNNPLRWRDPLGLAPGDVYTSPNAAGSQAIDDINGTSIGNNAEYAGWVYQTSSGGYSYTSPQQGTMVTSDPGDPPAGILPLGVYHTHGANVPGYNNDVFSPQDINASNAGLTQEYLGTPSGNIQNYDPFTGNTTWIGSTASAPSCGGR